MQESDPRQRSGEPRPAGVPVELPQGLVLAMEVTLLLAAGAAVLLLGAIYPGPRAAVHLLVAMGAGLALFLPDAALQRAGRMMRWLRVTVPVLFLFALSLVPVPRPLLALLAPGIAAARPADAWWTLGLRPEDAVGSIAMALLVIGFGAVVGVWGFTRHSNRRRAETPFVWLLLLLGLVAALHRLHDMPGVLGLTGLTTERQLDLPPLGNPNHNATLALLALPIAAVRAWREIGERRLRAVLPVLAVCAGVGVLLAAASIGPFAAAAVMGLAVVARRTRRWGAVAGAGVGLAALSVLALLAWVRWVEPNWAYGSFGSRLMAWKAMPALLIDHWATGTGAGAFHFAFPPYTTWKREGTFHHAHSEPLEWLAAHGLIGVLVAVWVVWALLPWPGSRSPRRAWMFSLGLLGVGVHALVDFPLRIPGVLLVATGALVIRWVVLAPSVAVSPRRVRQALGLVLVGLVVSGAWTARTAAADQAAREVQEVAEDPAVAGRAARTLRRTAPWRWELGIYEAMLALGEDPSEAALRAREVVRRHVDDATALHGAAVVLWRAGEREEALETLEGAVVRRPRDHQLWRTLSRWRFELGDRDGSVEAWAEALRQRRMPALDDVKQAYRLRPVGVWWVHALEDASEHTSNMLAVVLLADDPAAALLAFEQAERRQPPWRPPDARRVRALHALGDVAGAHAFLEDMLAHHPQDPHAWRELGWLYEMTGRYDEAVEAYLVALKIRPDIYSVKLGAIRAAETGGGAEAGLALVERLELGGHGDARTTLAKARLQLAANRPGACVRTIRVGRLANAAEVAADADRLRERCRAACTTCGSEGPP